MLHSSSWKIVQAMSVPTLKIVIVNRNSGPLLRRCLESVSRAQREGFHLNEVAVVDDASTDGSSELLQEWSQRDARISLHRSNKQLGLSGSSNAVVAKARAGIVARMDGDDVAHPDRLQRQWDVLAGNPDIAVVGTLCNGIDATGREVRPRDRWRLLRRSRTPRDSFRCSILSASHIPKSGSICPWILRAGW